MQKYQPLNLKYEKPYKMKTNKDPSVKNLTAEFNAFSKSNQQLKDNENVDTTKFQYFNKSLSLF